MSRLEIDPAALAELLTGPTGPVYRAVRAYADAVVADVKLNGPVGYDQGWGRETGQLVARMRILDETRGPSDISFMVGTDPVNRKTDFHYAERVHRGHGPVQTNGTMVFRTRDGTWHKRHKIGPAAAVPFLHDAMRRANEAIPGDEGFRVVER